MDGLVGEINIIHSFAHALCNCVYISRSLASGSEVNLFSRVVKFANSTRLAKINPREIYGVYSTSTYSQIPG